MAPPCLAMLGWLTVPTHLPHSREGAQGLQGLSQQEGAGAGSSAYGAGGGAVPGWPAQWEKCRGMARGAPQVLALGVGQSLLVQSSGLCRGACGLAGASRSVAGSQRASRSTCPSPAQPLHVLTPQPDSLKPFPMGRAQCFVEIPPPSSLPRAPLLAGNPAPDEGWGDTGGWLHSRFPPAQPTPPTHPAPSVPWHSRDPHPALQAAGPTRHHRCRNRGRAGPGGYTATSSSAHGGT